MNDDLHKRDAVKRYDHVDEYQRRAIAEEHPDGDYVAYDDYTALLARLEDVEKERDDACEELMAAQGQIADAQAAEARAEKAEAGHQRQLNKIKDFRDILGRNLIERDGPNTVTLPDGTTHTGAVVDFLHALMRVQIRALNAALDTTDTGGKDE